MRVLITGGCGFIGVNLVDHLLESGDFQIRVLDNNSAGTKNNLVEVAGHRDTAVRETSANEGLSPPSAGEVQLVIGDIRDRSACNAAVRDVDIVVHLAAQAGVVPSIEDPFLDCETNVVGTLNLLNAAVANGVDRFVLASSNAPLGEQTPPSSEAKLPKPLSPYGASKLACEAYCSAFYSSFDLKTVVLRFSNAYGPYSLHKASVVAKFIKDGLLGRDLNIYGDGEQTRDFIHVGDICGAIRTIVGLPENQLEDPKHGWGSVFHLGTGKETSVLKLTRLIQGLFDKAPSIVHTAALKGEIRRNYSDISKARDLLGFDPKIEIEAGVSAVFEWFAAMDIEAIKNAQILSGSD